jgi:hypothetical protein
MQSPQAHLPHSAIHSRAEATSLLIERMNSFLAEVPDDLLLKVVNDRPGQIHELLADLRARDDKVLSIQARNQLASARLRSKSFSKIESKYALLDANTASQLLGITRQALSKKGKVGQVIAYTNNGRKYFPDFQFEENAVSPVVGQLVKALEIDPRDEQAINLLIAFLAQLMDFSNVGELPNVAARYQFLADEGAFNIIVRDYQNRLEMGM